MPAVSRKAAKNGSTKTKAKKSESIDLYIRMNEDPHNDYCFSVPTNKPVSWLHTIFETLPVTLTPSYFVHTKPEGFAVSVHPGYLTAEGALLFTDEAHRSPWIKKVSDDALIGDVVTEGQLVLPIWTPFWRRQLLTIAVLGIWLYLDLPEMISPTPGTAPSRLLFRLAEIASMAPSMPSEETIFNSFWAQILFFVFHILKVGVIYLALWNGFWNPKSLNPFKRAEPLVIPKPEQLSAIGWTGARRSTIVNWEQKYHDHRTTRAGGVIEAYRTGELMKPKGYVLNPGEGWSVLKNSKIEDVYVEKDLLDADGKFVVSREYFLELAKPLSQQISKASTPSDDLQMIKEFRTYGYLDGPKVLQELFDDLIPMHKK